MNEQFLTQKFSEQNHNIELLNIFNSTLDSETKLNNAKAHKFISSKIHINDFQMQKLFGNNRQIGKTYYAFMELIKRLLTEYNIQLSYDLAQEIDPDIQNFTMFMNFIKEFKYFLNRYFPSYVKITNKYNNLYNLELNKNLLKQEFPEFLI